MEKKKTGAKVEKKENTKVAKAEMKKCEDPKCPFHGNLKARGRIFQGKVIRKHPKKITIEFDRDVYVKKYERFSKSRTKIHARLPDCMADQINIGDHIKIQECRPLSKIIHFVVIEKVKDAEKVNTGEDKQ